MGIQLVRRYIAVLDQIGVSVKAKKPVVGSSYVGAGTTLIYPENIADPIKTPENFPTFGIQDAGEAIDSHSAAIWYFSKSLQDLIQRQIVTVEIVVQYTMNDLAHQIVWLDANFFNKEGDTTTHWQYGAGDAGDYVLFDFCSLQSSEKHKGNFVSTRDATSTYNTVTIATRVPVIADAFALFIALKADGAQTGAGYATVQIQSVSFYASTLDELRTARQFASSITTDNDEIKTLWGD